MEFSDYISIILDNDTSWQSYEFTLENLDRLR